MALPTANPTTKLPFKLRSLGRILTADSALQYWLLLPTILVLLALTVYPYIYALRISTLSFRFGKPEDFIGLTNYANIWRDAPFWASLLRTVIFSILVVCVELVIGLVLALLANRITALRSLVRTGLVLPMSIATVVVCIIWRSLFSVEFGLLDYVTDVILHIGRPNWLGDLAFVSIIILDVWQWTPFMFLVLLAGLQAIPVELYDSAYVDGASELNLLRYVTLPLLSPTILVGVLVRTVDALRIFDQVFLLTSGGPGSTTEFVSLYIYKTAFKFSQMGYASALLFVLFFVTAVMALFYMFVLRRSGEAGVA
jgi:multiple sugar transport system permease protein